MKMNQDRLLKNRMTNGIHSFLLIMSLALLTGILGGIIGGGMLAVFAVAGSVVLYFAQPLASPQFIMRISGARRLGRAEAGRLYAALAHLSQRAGLSRVPDLYLIPKGIMNAFTAGPDGNGAIAVSSGLLRHMEPDETAAVLAHEISHIRHGDTGVMGFAFLSGQLIQTLSLFGQFLLLLQLPLIVIGSGDDRFGLASILVVVLAPWMSGLIQHALSRTREYAADLSAAQLLDDPVPLARALRKLENQQTGLLRRILWPSYPGREIPTAWRTHPPTEERIRRLLNVRADKRQPSAVSRNRSIPIRTQSDLTPRIYLRPVRTGRW